MREASASRPAPHDRQLPGCFVVWIHHAIMAYPLKPKRHARRHACESNPPRRWARSHIISYYQLPWHRQCRSLLFSIYRSRKKWNVIKHILHREGVRTLEFFIQINPKRNRLEQTEYWSIGACILRIRIGFQHSYILSYHPFIFNDKGSSTVPSHCCISSIGYEWDVAR